MINIRSKIGNIAYFILWVPINIALRLTKRTRILVMSDNKIVLVKSWLGANKWGLPGGGLKRNEKPAVGVVRELSEETGIVIEPSQAKYLGVSVVGKIFPFHFQQFAANMSKPMPLKKQKYEIVDARWVDINDLDGLKLATEVSEALALWRKNT